MSAPDFSYHLFGTHVRFGDGCASLLQDELSALGSQRPVVLMQARMAHTQAWAELRHVLVARQARVYATVPTHGSVDWVQDLAAELREQTCDAVVTLGGGSVSDTGKALVLLLAEGGCLTDHATRFHPPATVDIPVRTKPKLPILALPTTASGAEVTPSFGVRQGTHKLLFWNRGVASSTVLIDPQLSRDLPMALMRQTAMNGLAHCFEGLYSRTASPLASGIALQALDHFARALTDLAMPQDTQRRHLLLAGHLSGVVLSMARTALHHAICHVIGARHGAGHGEVNTVVLPHALRFNEPAAVASLAPALDMLNRVSGTRHACISDWVADVAARHGLPSSLSALGLREDDLPAIAAQVMQERGLAVNPRVVDHPDEVLSILRQAL